MNHPELSPKCTTLIVVGCMLLSLSVSAVSQTRLEIQNDGLTLSAYSSSEKNVLSTSIRVVGPGGFVFEDRNEDAAIQWIPEGDLPDGVYTWEVWTVTAERGAPMREIAMPRGSTQVVQSVNSISPHQPSNQAGPELEGIPLERFFAPQDKNVYIESGTFRVTDGWLEELDDEFLGSTDNYTPNTAQRLIGAILDFLVPAAHAQNFTDDVVVTKANPSVILDSEASVGQNWSMQGATSLLALRDIQNSNTVIGIAPGTGNANALRIIGDGRVGLGTAAPTEALHISDSTPRIRLQNLGDTQSWYVKNSNAGRFEIGESTNSGAFVIKPGAALSSLTINSSGDVGIGTDTPAQPLHVIGNVIRIEDTNSTWDLNPGSQGLWLNRADPNTFGILKLQNDAPANSIVAAAGGVGFGTDSPIAPIHASRADDTFEMLLLDQVNGSVIQDRNMIQLNNNGGIRFQFDNTALATQWRFQAATGNSDVFEIAKVGTGAIELELDAGGNLTIAGALTQQSDINSKRDIKNVDIESVLARLDQIQVSEWTYKTDEDGVRHLGPMAQNFHSVFSLGDDDTKIAPADMAGVALAAIQAQQLLIREQQLQIENLRSDLEGVKRLESRMGQMEARLPPLLVYSD